MADMTEILKIIAAPVVWMGSIEYRLRGKVSKREMDEYKKHVDTRIDDLKDFSRSQTGLILGEIKKTNGGKK